MHELAITRSAIDIIATAARTEGFRAVRRVRIAIGALSHLEPAAVRFCFAVAARGTVAEGADLTIEQPAGEAFCDRCRLGFPVATRAESCPGCGARDWRLTAGDELKVLDLEVV